MTGELKRRGCHAKVTRYCAVELLRKSNFHAAEEAVKGLFDRLREETGLTLDGAELVEERKRIRRSLDRLPDSFADVRRVLNDLSRTMRSEAEPPRNVITT